MVHSVSTCCERIDELSAIRFTIRNRSPALVTSAVWVASLAATAVRCLTSAAVKCLTLAVVACLTSVAAAAVDPAAASPAVLEAEYDRY